jgi:hypothetical protein
MVTRCDDNDGGVQWWQQSGQQQSGQQQEGQP